MPTPGGEVPVNPLPGAPPVQRPEQQVGVEVVAARGEHQVGAGRVDPQAGESDPLEAAWLPDSLRRREIEAEDSLLQGGGTDLAGSYGELANRDSLQPERPPIRGGHRGREPDDNEDDGREVLPTSTVAHGTLPCRARRFDSAAAVDSYIPCRAGSVNDGLRTGV